MRRGGGTIYLKSFYLYNGVTENRGKGLFSPNSNSPTGAGARPPHPFHLHKAPQATQHAGPRNP